jgi:hypothetical protein
MKLFTKAILNKLPKLYANDGKKPEEIKVPLKLFNPCGSQSWFITEYDPETKIAYGYVTGMQVNEFGYISIEELEAIKLPFGLGIERDIHWNSNTILKDVIDKKRT